jgi:4-hydroxy-3-polyprenylbenzoate decarboxylase
VDPDLELAAIADRVLGLGGPALLFENVVGASMSVAVNLLGTVERVVWSMGMERPEELKRHGGLAWDLFRAVPDRDLLPPCQLSSDLRF